MFKILKYTFVFSSFCLILIVGIIFLPNPVGSERLIEMKTQLENHHNKIKMQDYAVFIDYSLPVFRKRLWIVNLKNNEVVLNCHVAHAYNSGKIYPTKFSNTISSNISSKGAFVTGFDYDGNYGHAMKIHGLEKENNNVFDRTIVFHPAARYLYGIAMPIWTNGCFATSRLNMDKIINFTQNGSFIYVSV